MAIDRDKILEQAQKYIEKKKFAQAVAEYQKLIASDPNDARTHLKIGDLQVKTGAYPEAVATYEAVGRLYTRQGFALKAIAVYKQVREIIVKFTPQLEDKYGHIAPTLAELYQQLGLTSDALAALDEYAARLMNQGREREAVDMFRRIVDIDSQNPITHLRLAEAMVRFNQVDEALAEFHLGADLLQSTNRADERIKVFERMVSVKPDDAMLRKLALSYIERGAKDDGLRALQRLQPVFYTNRKDTETLALLAKAFDLIGQRDKSIEVRKEIVRIATEKGHVEQARDILAELSKIAPYDPGVLELVEASREAPLPKAPESLPKASGSMPDSNKDVASAKMQIRSPERVPPSPAKAAPQVYELDEEEDADLEVIESDPPAPMKPIAAPAAKFVAPVAKPIPTSLRDSAPKERAAIEIPSPAAPRVMTQQARPPSALPPPPKDDTYPPPAASSRSGARPAFPSSTNPTGPSIDEIAEQADSLRNQAKFREALQKLKPILALAPHRIDLKELHYVLLLDLGEHDEAIPLMVQVASMYAAMPDVEGAARTLQELLAYDPRNSRALQMLADLGYEVVPEEDAGATEAVELPEHDGHTIMAHEGGVYAEAEFRKAAPLETELSLEDALEEAEFYLGRQMYDEAKTILENQLRRMPNSPLLLERLQEARLLEQGIDSTSLAGVGYGGELTAFDALMPEAHDVMSQGDIDVEQVFMKFKEGVAATLSIDDSQAHYDLGLAYKEMGLFDDSISELLLGARDPMRASTCYAVIGMIERERGHFDSALNYYVQGLGCTPLSREQEAVLSYEIATLYEESEFWNDALQFYERSHNAYPGFRDTEERIGVIRAHLPRSAKR